MKTIRIFRRNIANAIKSIFRNFSLSVASVICTTITLVIVGISLIISGNINGFTKDIEGTFTIYAYVKNDATQEEIDIIKSKLLSIKNIRSDELIYKDKETVRQEAMKKEDENSAFYHIMSTWTEETNILEPEFVINVKELSELEETANTIKKIDRISSVQYSESIIKKIVPIFDIVKKITLVIILGLIIVTIFLICNTIKLTIFARKNEIEIMRLVGTSNFVIKLPFVIEGLFLGIIGAIIPIGATIWGYVIAYDKLGGSFFDFIKLIKPFPFTIYCSIALLVIGGIVGMVGSYTTVRKYLKI